MESYRTEEEQVEALRRWWNENGRSTVAAIVIALAASFGWQGWQRHQEGQQAAASDLYQAMLQAGSEGEQRQAALALADKLKADFGGSTYAQFAALHLARLAVENNDLAEAQAQLRWVLGRAEKGGDTEQVAQLRLARVLAAGGDADQALAILTQGGQGPYQASYAAARGDILLGLERRDEAREAYTQALMMAGNSQGQVNIPMVQQKLQSLSPVPARSLDAPEAEPVVAPAIDQDTQVTTPDGEES